MRPTLILLALLVALPGAAAGEQVTLDAARDNTLYEEGDLSNGAGLGLFAGATASSNDGALRRALVAFDVAAAVPAGATITRAELTLTVTMSVAGPQQVALHRLLADWGEGGTNAAAQEGAGAPATAGDATWRFRFFDTAAWSSEGGDFAVAASATASAGNAGAVTWASTPTLVADVQGWLDAPQSNFGWIVVGNEAAAMTAKRFASREATLLATRPRLLVEFDQAPVACVGDCNGDGTVAINELITGVNIALGVAAVDACASLDANSDGAVSISELIAAVNNALAGC